MKEYIIECPNCEGNIKITLNEDLTVQSVEHSEIELSEQEQLEALKNCGIEFG